MRFSFPDTEVREGPVRILFVCTGNICRSPLAEVLLRQGTVGLPVVVSSAGTHALEGYGMTEQNQRIASAHGAEGSEDHRARLLNSEMIKDADLVLTLSREHRRHVVNMLPRASRYTFTVREFGRLASALSEQTELSSDGASLAEDLREVVASVVGLRGTLPLLENPEDDDVIDPYRMDDAVYEESAAQLIPSISEIANIFRGSGTG